MTESAPQTAEATQESCCSGSSRKRGASAREVLDRRYAGGEITHEQYEEMKKTLGLTDAKASKKGCC